MLACSLQFYCMIIMNLRFLEYKISFFIFLFTLLINFSGVHSQSVNSHQDALRCEYLAKDAEKKYGLPENILLSISRVESGYQKVDGVIRAWPWTLNAGGDSSYFQTKEDALRSLEERIKKGVTNIDIGCMQLNFRWHKDFFNNLSDMINPIKNVDYAARFLNKLHQRHRSWEKAVKYYHSSKSKFNVKYYRKVKAVWKKENNESSLAPKLLAAVLEPKPKKANIFIKKEERVPLIKLDQKDQYLRVKESEAYKQDIKENKSEVVSAVNFHTMVDTNTEFDFTSFVKSISRKNTAVPKYIRDNWTIVLSIRNQLENSK
ncbi:MAG: hypothetical protein CM15mP98_08570 [Paracoccaceae bacterium]|nr:MAG: hypothetical protein CM15mP98_08570 [Paracoccaceae bacterium]